MDGNRRRIGPAIAMALGIAASLVLIALFPVYALGEWNRSVDPLDALRTQLTAPESALAVPALGSPVDPDTVTRLEDTRDGGFVFGALTTAGSIVAGVANAQGKWQSLCASAETGPNAQVTCESWASEGKREYGLWVQRSGSAPHGFRHEITYTQRGE